jgi:transposase-like protein
MGLLSKEQIRGLIKERNMKTTDDISLMLKDLFSETLQEMMEAELDTTLGYEKNESNATKSGGNRRNGHSKKTVVSEYGDSEILVPRDRDGEHDPVIVKKHQKNLTGIEEQIIALYSKGMTVRDIQDHLNHMYGVEISPTLVSNVTNKLMPIIKEWQNRPLERIYASVFLDAIHYKVRQEGVIVNKAPTWSFAAEPLALEALDSFDAVWGGKYPLIVTSWRNNWAELSTFFKYPPEIRKIIYTTNMIESCHRQLRKVTKGKSIFPNDESLQKMLYLATMDVLKKWTGRIQNWGQILLQLSVFFPDKVKSSLS